MDLSAPHNDEENPSLNELINNEDFSLSYVSIDDVMRLIKKCRKGALLIKTDMLLKSCH